MWASRHAFMTWTLALHRLKLVKNLFWFLVTLEKLMVRLCGGRVLWMRYLWSQKLLVKSTWPICVNHCCFYRWCSWWQHSLRVFALRLVRFIFTKCAPRGTHWLNCFTGLCRFFMLVHQQLGCMKRELEREVQTLLTSHHQTNLQEQHWAASWFWHSGHTR